jgi:hypothetical protein
MAAPNYLVVNIDLAVARLSGQRVNQMDAGVKYDGVNVLAIPAGALAALAFGSNRQFLPLGFAGQEFEFLDECGRPFKADEGLFVQNPAGAGTLTLLVSLGTISAGGG